jgi:3-deoxy-manno-octulosonate cytidylyltransferase (CMP-KDO synthetase)
MRENEMEFRVIIPVRYASPSLPGKYLLDIAGKPMLQHVYELCLESGAESVVIATDHEQIAKAAKGFGAEVCMTSAEHQSGTERVAEAIVALGYEDEDIIVTVQGDEPLAPSELIHQVASNLLKYDGVKVATLCEPINKSEDLFNPNVIKIVTNRRGYALCFSRAPITWEHKNPHFSKADAAKCVLIGEHYRHIRLYAYRAGFLQEYVQWEPCSIEQMECLEQLRILWNCSRIQVGVAKKSMPFGVDTEEDLEKIRAIFAAKKT